MQSLGAFGISSVFSVLTLVSLVCVCVCVPNLQLWAQDLHVANPSLHSESTLKTQHVETGCAEGLLGQPAQRHHQAYSAKTLQFARLGASAD